MTNMVTLKDLIVLIKTKNIDAFLELLSDYIYINKSLVQAIQLITSKSDEGYIIIYLISMTVTVMELEGKIIVHTHYIK